MSLDSIEYCEECGEELLEGEIDFCADCAECIDYDDYDDLIDGVGFANPGGNSALRAATPNNPRDRPCPTCGRENVLTRIDEENHYQCDYCADSLERGF